MALLNLENRVAIVTGAAQNIGRSVVLELARAGTNIVVADIQAGKTRRVVREIERLDRAAFAVQVDISDRHEVNKMAAQVAERFGRIDILVNNACTTGKRAPVETLEQEQWDAMHAVCLRGALFCSQAVIPFMRKQGKGKIINISSVVFWLGAANCSAYISAKGGLIGLTRGLARELGQYNINVNAITPGAVKTVEEKHFVNPKEIDLIVNSQCLRRRVLPRDIATVVIFLASSLSDAMTGQTINVDAGWAMH